MGEVYLAEDTRLKRQVAIKILAADSNADEDGSRRLVREAQAAAALDHPNICSIYEVGEQDGRAFIVMQDVEGETLAARIQRKRLAVSEMLEIAIPVADGLAEAHARGIVHRDIKPQNIMITARGQAKILDFGLAKAAADADAAGVETQSLWTQAGAIVGTAPYMSPEQVKGQALDARSDIFSYGVVLYELLSGHVHSARQRSPKRFRQCSPLTRRHSQRMASRRRGVERVLRQCLRKDREQRYQSMREVRLELESVRRDTGKRRSSRSRGGRCTAAESCCVLIAQHGRDAHPTHRAGDRSRDGRRGGGQLRVVREAPGSGRTFAGLPDHQLRSL